MVSTLFVIFIFTPWFSYGATYYFSSSDGNDTFSSTQAQHAETPWKTLNKLNSFFSNLNAGDFILFKRGDVFEGSIHIIKSGSSGLPISFGAYGQGNKPEISGFTFLQSWTSAGSGIYESPCNAVGNNVVINDIQQAMGRYPNKGYLSFQSSNGNTAITDNQLSGAPNWKDAEVVIRKNRWTIDRSTITEHNGGTITYTGGSTASPTNGYGYFIQKSLQTLDQLGEWYFDEDRKRMMIFLGSANPASFRIRVSTSATLVDINGSRYITFSDLAFTGAGVNAFHLVNSGYITVENCKIDFTGSEAVLASYSPYIRIANSDIDHSLSGGINLDVGCTHATVLMNQISHTALMPGMGRSGTGTYEGITSFGDFTQIERNIIDSTGYNAIYFGGNSSYAKNNFINYFCLTKDDGAGIYVGDWSETANKKITGNIILNGIGTSEGTNYIASLQAEGIYIDDLSKSVMVTDNTVAFCTDNGIKLHNAQNIQVSGNLIYNNGAQLKLEQDHYQPNSAYLRDNTVQSNIFFSKTELQPTAKFTTHQDDIVLFGQLDSNVYARPIEELSSIVTSLVRQGKDLNEAYDLAGWKSAYGKDTHSSKTKEKIPSYKIKNLIGSNKFSNGSFNSNIDGLYWYSTINDCSGSFITGVLDGGALKLSFNTVSAENHVTVNMKVGKISANKKYVLKFSMSGTQKGKLLQTFLRKTGAPYTILSDQKDLQISDSRSENEYLFSSNLDDDDASIIFDIDQPAGQLYFDNIQLFEAEVSPVNSDDYILFEYNAQNSAKSVYLTKNYVDVFNRPYIGNVTINPYSSILLIATDKPVIKSSQTITLIGIQSKTYDNKPVTLAATASSGLPVSFSVVSGPGSVSGNQLSFTGLGTVKVQASQSGNELFEPAIAITEIQNLATGPDKPPVAKSAQTIALSVQTITYGSKPVALAATASSGLPVSFSVVSGPGSVSGNQLNFSGLGTVKIQASQAGNDLFEAAVAVTEVQNLASDPDKPIVKSAQTIALSVQTITYGSKPVTLAATASSGLPVSFSVVSGPGSVSGNQLNFSGLGTVKIQASQAGNDLFEAAVAVTEVQNLASDPDKPIVKSAQTIALSVQTITYGSKPVMLAATASSGLPVSFSVVSGPGSISGNQLNFSGLGTVKIQASQAGNDLFEAAVAVTEVQNLALDPDKPIVKSAQTIVLSVQTITYGSKPVALAATASSGLPVSFSVVSGPGSVSGNQLNFSGLGTVKIQASQAGNDLFEAAVAVTEVQNLASDPDKPIAKSAQSIALVNIKSTTYESKPVELTAVASSGLPVFLSVLSGPGYITGTQLNFTGLGTVKVQASQPGNDLFEAAVATTEIVNLAVDPDKPPVVKSAQTILLTGIDNVTYDSKPLILTATASSGLPVTLNVLSGPGYMTGNLLNFNGFGTVKIQVSQPGNNFFNPVAVIVEIENLPATDADQKLILKAYPNPFTDKLTLEFIMPEAGNVTLKLYDLQGKLVTTIYSGFIRARELQSFVLDASSLKLENNQYLVRLVSGKKFSFQKIILIR